MICASPCGIHGNQKVNKSSQGNSLSVFIHILTTTLTMDGVQTSTPPSMSAQQSWRSLEVLEYPNQVLTHRQHTQELVNKCDIIFKTQNQGMQT